MAVDEGLSVYRPCGDIVASSVEAARRDILAAVKDSTTRLVVDLSQVQALDSSGLSVLLGVYMSLRERGAALCVVNASPELRELFRDMRLDKHFSVSGA